MYKLNRANKFFITILVSLLTACSHSSAPKMNTIIGQWQVISIQETPVLNKSIVNISFDKENKLSGVASCNNISSQYTQNDNALIIGPVATTRKMCPPTLMSQESLMISTLSKVKRFQLMDDSLTMYDQKGAIQIEAQRIK